MSPRGARLAGKRPESSINAQPKLGIKERKYPMSKKLITACLGLFALAAFVLPAMASASPVLTHPTGTALQPVFEGAKSKNCAEGGTCITATNVGETFFMSDLSQATQTVIAQCSKAVITGSLTKNNGTEIEGDITTATFSGSGAESINSMTECTGIANLGVTANGKHAVKTGGALEKTDNEEVSSATPWCLAASGATDTFTVRGGTCSEASRKITFILDSTFSKGVSTECKYERTAAIQGTYTTDTSGDAVLTVVPGETAASREKTTFKGETGNNILCPSLGTLQMSLTLETDKATAEPLYIS